MISQDDVVDYLKNVTLIELRGLISTLEDELGVKTPDFSYSREDIGLVDDGEVQTEFNVVLQGFEGKKVALIKVVRQVTGLGLKDAKTAVESAPYIVKESMDRESADALAESMRAVGGLVDVI